LTYITLVFKLHQKEIVMIKVFTGLLVLLILSACAVVDLSSQDSARTLPLKQFELSSYTGSGLNLYSTQNFDTIMAQVDSMTFWSNSWRVWDKRRIGSVWGLKYALGIAANTELGVKTYLSSGTGFQVGIKRQFFEKGSIYSAFQVSGHAMLGGINETTDTYHNDQYKNRDKSDIYGFELRWLLTSQTKDSFSSTLSPHYSFHRLYRNHNGIDYGPYDIMTGGINGNIRFNIKSFFVVLEAGIEAAEDKKGDLTPFGMGSLGLGFKLE